MAAIFSANLKQAKSKYYAKLSTFAEIVQFARWGRCFPLGTPVFPL